MNVNMYKPSAPAQPKEIKPQQELSKEQIQSKQMIKPKMKDTVQPMEENNNVQGQYKPNMQHMSPMPPPPPMPMMPYNMNMMPQGQCYPISPIMPGCASCGQPLPPHGMMNAQNYGPYGNGVQGMMSPMNEMMPNPYYEQNQMPYSHSENQDNNQEQMGMEGQNSSMEQNSPGGMYNPWMSSHFHNNNNNRK
ncbi:hypothetical protein [Alteribacillus sp. HJP-4]|uniref:hypothetical protein n=1 Tax=Alteribacillus sp. HJP-4 TaxID=2775394 RepID=UPI0035CD2851